MSEAPNRWLQAETVLQRRSPSRLGFVTLPIAYVGEQAFHLTNAIAGSGNAC